MRECLSLPCILQLLMLKECETEVLSPNTLLSAQDILHIFTESQSVKHWEGLIIQFSTSAKAG